MMLFTILLFVVLKTISANNEVVVEINKTDRLYITHPSYVIYNTHSNATHFMELAEIKFKGSLTDNHVKPSHSKVKFNYIINAEITYNKIKCNDYHVFVLNENHEISDESFKIESNIMHKIIKEIIQSKVNMLTNESEIQPLNSDFLSKYISDLNITELFSKIRKDYSERKLTETKSCVACVMLDYMLQEFVRSMQHSKNGVMELPDYRIVEDSTHYLIAYYGKIRNLSTLYRAADYSINHDKTAKHYTIFSILGMSDAHAQYNYEAKYSIFWAKGDIHVQVYGLQMQFQIKMDYSTEPCSLLVERIHFTFDDLDVGFSGLGPFNQLVARKIKEYMKNNRADLVEFLNRKVKNMLQSVVEKFNCEDLKKEILGN